MSSNQAIIIQEGIKHGYFSETQVELWLLTGQLDKIDLHTASYWRDMGQYPKKGEHAAIVTKLWKKARDGKYYLVKTNLFSSDQVEDIKL